MLSVSRRTFKDLYSTVLQWTGDADDQAQMRDLAKDAVARSHERRLTSGRFAFMLFPKPQSLVTVAGQQAYSLNEAFLSPLYMQNLTLGQPVNLPPYQNIIDLIPSVSGEAEGPSYATIHGVSKLQKQPTAASRLTVTGENGKKVKVYGETANGLEEEELTAPTQGSVQFITVLDVTKTDTWTATMTLSAENGGTLLTLSPTQYGRQFRQLWFPTPPNSSHTLEYQFFRHPKRLSHDNDIPDTPYPFDQLHILDALIELQGFTRATPAEIRRWEKDIEDIEANMNAAYADVQGSNADAVYGAVIER